MHHHLKAVRLSHQNAPLHVREMVALDEHAGKQLLIGLKDVLGIPEALVLSTCNRTEVYYSSPDDRSADVIKLLCAQKGIEYAGFHAYFASVTTHNEAVRYLFEVSLGLHAQVVGDMQITNQVKNAYQWAADLDMAGPFLHRLMHAIFFTNKRVVQETAYRDGAASISYAAVELLEELTTDLVRPRVLVVGLGEIGTDVCKNLAKNRRMDIRISNRTAAKAEELVREYGFTFVPFDNVWAAMTDADVVISSVSRQTPFITHEAVAALNIISYKYFIDLAVPRSVATSVEEIPGALVYNIDHIQAKASEALEKRLNAIPQVQQIVNEAIAEFHEWSRDMSVSPTIHKLKNAMEQIRQEEMARYLKNLTPDEIEKMDRITKGMMQKIIKLPVLQLKAACKRGEAETLIDVLNDLFNLEKQPEKAAE